MGQGQTESGALQDCVKSLGSKPATQRQPLSSAGLSYKVTPQASLTDHSVNSHVFSRDKEKDVEILSYYMIILLSSFCLFTFHYNDLSLAQW